jgi:hypothetical protein
MKSLSFHTAAKQRKCCLMLSMLVIIHFMPFKQLFHISNTQTNFSPSEEVRGMTIVQNAGRLFFAQIFLLLKKTL